jgi:hypothetical protein
MIEMNFVSRYSKQNADIPPAALELPGRYVLLIHFVFEKVHSLNKGRLRGNHDHINGIEVFPAIKTSCKVCFGINARMEVSTHRTTKSE